MELRERQRGKEGRTEQRKGVKIEHNLAKVEQVQGERARYKGARKNTIDVRRCAVVVNLQTILRMAKAA